MSISFDGSLKRGAPLPDHNLDQSDEDRISLLFNCLNIGTLEDIPSKRRKIKIQKNTQKGEEAKEAQVGSSSAKRIKLAANENSESPVPYFEIAEEAKQAEDPDLEHNSPKRRKQDEEKKGESLHPYFEIAEEARRDELFPIPDICHSSENKENAVDLFRFAQSLSDRDARIDINGVLMNKKELYMSAIEKKSNYSRAIYELALLLDSDEVAAVKGEIWSKQELFSHALKLNPRLGIKV